MVARKSTSTRCAAQDATATSTPATRVGATLVFSEILHPSREDPMNNPAVFAEYAQSDAWTAIHLLQGLGFLLLLGGLVALSSSLGPRRGVAMATFALASALTAAASFTVLRAVDGVALKRGGRVGDRPGGPGGCRLRGLRRLGRRPGGPPHGPLGVGHAGVDVAHGRSALDRPHSGAPAFRRSPQNHSFGRCARTRYGARC